MNAIIAVNPQQMAEAQTQTVSWVDAKLADAQHELVEAKQVEAALGGASLRRSQAASMVTRAKRRIGFYEKVKAALDAGYYIVPPFPLQLFAIRTNRMFSPDELSTRHWASDQKATSLPVGEGRYVSPAVSRFQDGTQQEKNHDGTMREVELYRTGNWQDVELPVRALKPQIIEEVGRALELRIFDALGIAPAYRAADPIICGEIKRPGGGVLTFFVAWWLDQADL